jgi:hypothetical protein
MATSFWKNPGRLKRSSIPSGPVEDGRRDGSKNLQMEVLLSLLVSAPIPFLMNQVKPSGHHGILH